MPVALIDVTEFTDPCCSYAWGTEPKVRRLRWCYGDRIRWRRVMAGLSARGWHHRHGLELDDPALAAYLSDYWKDVSALTGMPYPSPLHRTAPWSEDACRMVKAAELQSGPPVAGRGDDPAARLLRRLRESWFVFGRPAATFERAAALARGIDGLDADRLLSDVKEPGVEAAYQADWEETRNPSELVRNLEDDRVGMGKAREHNGRMRYGLPTLIFRGPAGEVTVPGLRPWEAYEEALEVVAPGITAAGRPLPTPDEVFAAWPLVAEGELAFLCGPAAVPPPGVVSHRWDGGQVWMTAPEALALSTAGLLD